MQPAISASHLLRGSIFTHLTYPESSRKKIAAKVHIGREEYTLHVHRPLTQKHLDIFLAIIKSAKRAFETPDGGLVVEFTGHGVLKALGDRHARNHAWLWTMIRQMQSCLITVINADGRKIRFPLIASSGFTPDSSEFRTVHHAGVTADASYYHVRFSGEMMAFVRNDIHVHLPPGVLQSIFRMKSLMLKYFVWRCVTTTRRRGPLGRVINQILPADASRFARCRMRRMVIENREVLKALGVHVEQKGDDYYLEWTAKAAKVFFQVPAKNKQSAFSQAYDAMLYQRTMAQSARASNPQAVSDPPRQPVADGSVKPVAQAEQPEAVRQIVAEQAKVDPPKLPVVVEENAPAKEPAVAQTEVVCRSCDSARVFCCLSGKAAGTAQDIHVCVGDSAVVGIGIGTVPKEQRSYVQVAAHAAEVNFQKEERKMGCQNHKEIEKSALAASMVEAQTSTSAAPLGT